MEKQEIFERMASMMVDMFDLDRSSIKLESKIFEDLDLDSLDAIDMVVKLEELTGHRLQEAELRTVRTVQDVVNLIHAKFGHAGDLNRSDSKFS